MIGETLGNFRILSRLGKGGMGEVFLAEQTALHTKVAVKVLHEDISRDTDHVQRFFNEARIVGRIKHQGIVKIFDCGFHTGHAYLIMELLEGESLATRLDAADSPLAPGKIAAIARQIASILDATHRAGVIHRDLKPDNIFLVPDEETGERVKILDFGIAKLSGTLAGAASPKTQGTMGTPAYMAPEQWGDSAKVDWRADAYSLGCVVYEMAAGHPPFEARTIAEAYTMHLHEPAPIASDAMPNLPREFDTLVGKLLEKAPEQRTLPMAEIANAFAELATKLRDVEAVPRKARVRPIGADASSGTDPTQAPAASINATTLGDSLGEVDVKPARKRRGWPFAIAGIGMVVAGVVIAVVALNGGGEKADAPKPPPVTSQPVPPPLPRPDLTIYLTVTSDPPGAEVFKEFDGTRLGLTPLTFPTARGAGTLPLVVRLDHYQQAKVELSLADNNTQQVALVADARPTEAKKPPATVIKKPPATPETRKTGDLSKNPYDK